MFDGADRQAMLEAVGIPAQLVGDETFLVKPPHYPDPQTDYSGMDLNTVNPCCIADKDDLQRLSIIAGEEGTLVTISERQYRILSKLPAVNGFVVLELGAC